MKRSFLKGICGFMALVIAAGYIPPDLVHAAQASDYSADINGDGKVDEADRDAILHLIGDTVETLLSDDGYEAYDANGNGIVDSADALAIQQYVEGTRDTLPAPQGSLRDDNVTLSLSGGSSFVGDQVTLELSIVDWSKDIGAYDIVLHTSEDLTPEAVICSDAGRYVFGGNTIRIFGVTEDLARSRGKLAEITLSSQQAGDFFASVDAANLYASDMTFYRSNDPTANITVYDTIAPVALQASGISSASAMLQWAMPFSDNHISGFTVYRDGVQIAETVETHFLDESLKSDTEYTYTVRANDVLGKQTEDSLPLTITTAAPEIVSAVFPQDVVTVNHSDLTVTLAQKTLLSALSIEIEADTPIRETIPFDTAGTVEVRHHLDVSTLASGVYPVTITATDRDGAEAIYPFEMRVLTDLPAPLTLTAYAGSETATLTWDIAVEADVVRYCIYRKTADDAAYTCIATIDDRTKLDYTDSQLVSGTAYTYAVTAVNSYGLEGLLSNEETIIPEADTVIPEITRFSPTTGTRLRGEFSVLIQATDNSRMDHVACFLSADAGETWEEVLTAEGNEGAWSLDSTQYADGIYQLKAMAYDAAGNQSLETSVISLAFDNTAPEQVSGIRLEALYPTQATLAWDDVADEDFSAFLLYLSYGDKVKTYTINKQLGINLTGLTAGTQYIATISAIDQTGNIGAASEAFIFTTPDDTDPPVVTQLKLGNYIRNGANFIVEIYATDTARIARYYVEISQDGETWTTYSSSSNQVVVTPQDLEDGTVYVRAYATDIYENTGDPESAKVTEILADSTAPEPLSDVTAVSILNGASLTWTAPANEPGARYLLQRSSYANKGYTTLENGWSATSYTDRNLTPGETYYYRIAVYDVAGNLSAYSEPVSVTVNSDTTAPIIQQGMLSIAGIICEKYHTFQVIASDETRLSSVTLEMRCDDETEWTTLECDNIETNNNATQMHYTMELPETVLEAKLVNIRVIATDAAGNVSTPQEFSYPVDNRKTVIENFTAVQNDRQVHLSWKCPDITDVSYFFVYRTIDDGYEYTLARILPKADVAEYTYDDMQLSSGGSYAYHIQAVRTSGNETDVYSDPLEIHSIPKANLICVLTQKVGAEYFFDATGSTNAADITSIVMDYGDGTFDTASQTTDAKFRHSYETAGVYTVTLTCTNADGVSDTSTAVVTVEDASQLAQVTVHVATTEGEAAAYATVYLDVGSDQQVAYETDAQGTVTFFASAGEHEIGVFGDGYLPMTKTCTLYAGANNKVDFSVVCDKLVDASFEITRMTLEEIVAAGIDIDDPDNAQVVKIDVVLKYSSNANNPNNTDNLHIYYDSNTGHTYLPDDTREAGYHVQAVHTNEKQQIDAIMIMHIPTEVHMLKEFFNVKMIVVNNAAAEFSLDDCTVSLNVPEGMTLMEQAKGASPQTAYIESIAGGTSAEINWILRGDQAGEYDISANFLAKLAVFNVDVDETFQADQKIQVYGASALEINLNLNTAIRNNRLLVEIAMKNVSKAPLYMVGGEIDDTVCEILNKYGDSKSEETATATLLQSRIIDTENVLLVTEELTDVLEELAPGETFSLVYGISGFDKEHNFKPLIALRDSLEWNASSNTGGEKVRVNIAPVSLTDTSSIYYGIAFDKEKDFLLAVRNHAHAQLGNTDIVVYHYEADEKIIDASGTTDSRGRLVIPRGNPEVTYYLSAKREGYDNGFSILHFPTSTLICSETIVLRGDFVEADYKVDYASISTDTNRRATILRNSFTLTENDGKEFDIQVKSAPDAVKFELVQDNRVIAQTDAENGMGLFEDLKTRSFRPTLTVEIRTYTPTGEYVETQTMLFIREDPERYKDDMINEILTELGDDQSFTVKLPEEWVAIGGLGITFEFPTWYNLGAKIEFTDTSFTVTINSADSDDEEAPDRFPFKKLELFKLGKASGTLGMGAQFEGKMDERTRELSLTGKIYVTFEFGGDILGGQIPIAFPLYWGLSASISCSAGLQYSYCTANDGEHKFRVMLNPGLEVSPSISVGFDEIIGLGLYGNLGVDATFLLPPFEVDSVNVKGALGVQFELFSFKYQIALVEVGGQIYPRTVISKDEAAYYGLSPEEFDKLYEEQNNGNGGNGERTVLLPVRARALTAAEIGTPATWHGTLSNTEAITMLQETVSASAAPQLISNGDTTMLLWCVEDAARGARNASYLVYSCYDAATDTWCEPKALDNNHNADYHPIAYATKDGIYVAYQESDAVFADTDSIGLEAYAQQLSLKTARYDASTGVFTDLQTVTPAKEGSYLSSPRFVADADGKLYLFHTENTNCNLFANDKSNNICYAVLEEDGWSQSEIVAEQLPALSATTCGLDTNGAPFVAYIIDPECDFESNDDRQLYISDLNGTTLLLAEGTLSSLQYSDLPQGGKGLLWLQDGTLRMCADCSNTATLLTTNDLMLTGNYAVAGNRVLFVARHADTDTLCSTSYDAQSDTMTEPIVIAAPEGYQLGTPQITEMDNEILYVISGIHSTQYEKEYDTNCTLFGGKLMETTDLTLDAANFYVREAAADTALPIALTLTNAGTQPIDTCTATLLDEDGTVLAEEVLPVALISGQTTHARFTPVLPTSVEAKCYSVQVTASAKDANPNDNVKPIDLSTVDLSIESKAAYDDGNGSATILVTNESMVPTAAYVVATVNQEETITLLSDEIAPHTSAVWTVDAQELLGTASHEFVTLKVVSDVKDSNEDNNTDILLLSLTGRNDELLGDVTFDGQIDAEDAVLALRIYVSGLIEKTSDYSAAQIWAADVDRNSESSADDAIMILRYYVHSLLEDDETPSESLETFIESQSNGGTSQ